MTPASIKVSIPGKPAQPGVGEEGRAYAGCPVRILDIDTRIRADALFQGCGVVTLPERVPVPDRTTPPERHRKERTGPIRDPEH